MSLLKGFCTYFFLTMLLVACGSSPTADMLEGLEGGKAEEETSIITMNFPLKETVEIHPGTPVSFVAECDREQGCHLQMRAEDSSRRSDFQEIKAMFVDSKILDSKGELLEDRLCLFDYGMVFCSANTWIPQGKVSIVIDLSEFMIHKDGDLPDPQGAMDELLEGIVTMDLEVSLGPGCDVSGNAQYRSHELIPGKTYDGSFIFDIDWRDAYTIYLARNSSVLVDLAAPEDMALEASFRFTCGDYEKLSTSSMCSDDSCRQLLECSEVECLIKLKEGEQAELLLTPICPDDITLQIEIEPSSSTGISPSCAPFELSLRQNLI